MQIELEELKERENVYEVSSSVVDHLTFLAALY
jgi:hypothetical protein